MSKKRICIFCGSDKLTKEHVFPDWMSRLFPKATTATHTAENKGKVEKSFQTRVFQHTAKIVCGNCNNGWMANLEASTKPILSKMLFDLNYTTTLTKKEQTTLAFWAQKTAMILNQSTGADFKIPAQTYHELAKENKPIDYITVRIGWRLPKQGKNGKGRQLSHYTVGEITGPEKQKMIETVGDFTAWRAIIAIGNVVFHISGSTPNIRIEVGNNDDRVTPQIHPYIKDLHWPLEWPVDALTSVGLEEFANV
jgi:hypothetical protein